MAGFAVLPVASLQAQRPFFADEREQYFSNALHFERLGDRLDTFAVVLGAGWRPLPELSVGLGASLQNRAASTAGVYSPDVTVQESALTQAGVEVDASLAPHIGLEYRPLADERLRLAATLHLESANRIEGSTRLRFWNYEYPQGQDALRQRFRQTIGHEPLRAALMAAGRPWDGIELAVGGRYTHWSAYRTRMDEPVEGWSDVVEAMAGSVLSLDTQRISLGLLYAASPVPIQSGRTSFVDNARVGVQTGYTWELPLATGVLSLGATAMIQALLERRQEKDAHAGRPVVDEFPGSVDVQSGEAIAASSGLQTNNPGFPGYRSSGWLFGGGLTLGWSK